ncbi:MAG TPA: leishmanolysin-related zinc metalloendopeptidase [Sphingomicrobium sp.]|nr:leishmanolysin-related zinc metalloendopeptidase [Sphingomicrobium sp.]
MRNGSSLQMRGQGSAAGVGRGIDLRPDLPFTTDRVVGIDLTRIIHVDEVASARGGNGGGGGGGGTGGTTFAPYTSGAVGAYNITIEFVGSWTQDLYNIFVSSANTLSTLIIGDLPNVSVRSKGGIQTIDDIKIVAELGAIDGEGNILGQAGPTSVRTTSSLPATAEMTFDIADVTAMGLEMFEEVVLHEMAHSLGVGSIWGRLGLVTNGLFTGEDAVAEYHELGGTLAGIPVEQDGGAGTAGSHWDEEIFDNELMTGYINSGNNPLSEMTAASFADLGYTLASNYGNVAEIYEIPTMA